MYRIVLLIILSSCALDVGNRKKNEMHNDSLSGLLGKAGGDTYNGRFLGQKEKVKFPLRIGAFGNRFFNEDNEPFTLSESTALEIKNKLGFKFSIDQNYQVSPGFSYGYVEINKNIAAELFGFGWNDIGLSDDVKYFNYLIIHDSIGNVIDFKLVGDANNMDNTLKYTEFYWENPFSFNVIDYIFTKYESCKECKYQKTTPILVGFLATQYNIMKNGKIVKIKEVKTKEFQCETKYNEFGGIFESNQKQLLSSKYWLIP